MYRKKTRFAATIVAVFFATLIFAAIPANAADSVVTGQYRCPGNFPGGLFHEMTFTATDLGTIHVETKFGNLDTGDCTPRGNQARALVQGSQLCSAVGSVVTPIYFFQPGGGSGSAFDFVCSGTPDKIRDFIQSLSTAILTPTQ